MNKLRNHRLFCVLSMVLVLSMLLISGGVCVLAEEESHTVEGSGVIYDADDVVVAVTGTEEESDYFLIDYEITNNRDKEVVVDMYPTRINQEALIGYGLYEIVGAGETVSGESYLSLADLQFAGLASVWSVEGCLYLEDAETYETLADPVFVTLYTGDGEGDASGLTHSDKMLYDKDGIQISYLGSCNNDFYGEKQVLLVTNDTDSTIYIDNDYGTEKIDGEITEDTYMASNSCPLPAGDKTLFSFGVLDNETYEAVPYETIDLDLVIASEDNTRDVEMIPIHVKKEADAYSVVSEEAGVLYDSADTAEYEQEQEAEEMQQEVPEADAGEIQGPEIEEAWICNQEIGISHNDALITLMVHNPNEHSYLYDLEVSYEAYDADNNLICNGTETPNNRFAVSPGETLPYVLRLYDLEFGTQIDHVTIVNSVCSVCDEIELEGAKDSEDFVVTTDEIHLDNIEVVEGNDNPYLSETFEIYEASVKGTLVNEAEASEAFIVLVLYDSNGEIIATSVHLEYDLPAESSTECQYYLDTGLYTLPGYDHTDVYVLK